MTVDAARYEELARLLLNRADDLYYVGQQLVTRTDQAQWKCAKAVRFRQSMRGRRGEAERLATTLRDLGRWLRAQGAAAGPIPATMPKLPSS